jgi:L-seryl-tRNA(Ser) seleniumtransferase
MVHAPLEEIQARAEAFARRLARAAPELEMSLQDGRSAVGGGAAPTLGVPTVVIAFNHPALAPDGIATALRAGQPPVVVRVAGDRLLVDLRTVPSEDESTLLDALVAATQT